MSAVISDQQSGPKVAEFFSPGPGERLRAARLSMGYDIGKIASEMHLTSSIVEQLEADEYEGIGARVFVRGYLRNYARIVEMPADTILRQFDEKWPDDPQQKNMLRESPRLPADGVPSRGWAGAMTWLIVVGLIALFLMWWQGYLDDLVPESDSTAEVDDVAVSAGAGELAESARSDTDQPVLPADGSLLLPTLPSSEPTSAIAPPATVPLEPASPAAATPTQSQPSASLVAPAAETTGAALPRLDAVAPTATPSATGNVDAAPAEQSTGPRRSEAAASGATGAPVVDATTGIVMTFSAPCWVDVRDSTRKFKLFGEMPKGSRRVLGGEPPYQLVIGNARAVTIEINGEPFDISRFAKGNVARFTLDP